MSRIVDDTGAPVWFRQVAGPNAVAVNAQVQRHPRQRRRHHHRGEAVTRADPDRRRGREEGRRPAGAAHDGHRLRQLDLAVDALDLS
jgi:hypothetical protein